MRRFTAPFTVLVLLVRAAAAQAPYRVSWWDGASVLTAGVLGEIPKIAKLPSGPPPCAPCDPGSLSGFDRIALHTFSGSAATASTVTLIGDRKSTRLNSSHSSISYA